MAQHNRPAVVSELWLQMLEEIDLGVSLLEIKSDSEAMVVFVNSAYARELGYVASDIIGKPYTYLFKFLSGRRNDVITLRRVLLSSQKSKFMLRMVNHKGVAMSLRVQAIPCRLPNISTQYMLLIHQNLTEWIDTQQVTAERCAELSVRNQELQDQTVHDPLSGLYNRRFLDPEFRRLAGYHARRGSPMALGFIDIDYFKRYNDGYGHIAGDRVIAKIGEHLKNHFSRVEDLCARYGGEEFVVITGEDDSAESVYRHFDRFRNMVEELKIEHKGSECSDYLTVSIGVYFGVPEENGNPEELLRLADETMYRAKQSGRNRTEIALANLAGRKAGQIGELKLSG